MFDTDNLMICPDADALAARATELIVAAAREAISQRDRFTFVLSGGSTPEKTYRHLASPKTVATIDWSKSCLFVGDERFVPYDNAASNFGMFQRSLLAHVPVPKENVFPMPTDCESAAQAALQYAQTLARFFGQGAGTFPPPSFDMLLLGLGDDGHTASLFPGMPALDVTDAWVTSSPPGVLPPPVERVTFTFPLLKRARHVLFLVAGENKAEVMREILEGRPSLSKSPAAGVRPESGALTWLVDEAAARLLSPAVREKSAK